VATLTYPSPLELEHRRSLRILRYIVTTDHKEIGHLYLVATLVFFVLAGFEALLIRVQLAVPGNTFLQPGSYDAVFTTHGVTMIFFVIMPMLLGFANYVVPLEIGARDMAFPRLNAFSFWLLAFGGLLFYFGFLAGAPPDTGWFSYAPLTLSPYTLQPSSDYWALGLLVSGFGTIATGLNLVVTVIKLRAPGMTWFRMPVFTWMSFVTGILILAAIPALTAAQIMLLFDRFLGTHFFDPSVGGDPVLWQHLFWYFGHPEVYIMALPAFGIISEVLPVYARKPIFGYPVVVASGIAIAFLSMSVWAHHMFTVGLGELADAAFGFSSMLIAIPTGIKVFSWLGTMWGGRLRLTTSMLYAIAFVAQFTLGGLSGVHFATVPIDWHTHDSYYVVAHFHYVLGGGSLFAILAATYYWFPKITGRLLDERTGKIGFWFTFFGFNLTFFPMHILGLMGQPRRTWTYPDLPGWGAINMLATIGAFILGIGVLLLLWNILQAFRHGEAAGDNPWDAWTLEWATSSPPPAYNFAALPPIESARPLWDLHHPAAVAARSAERSEVERQGSVTQNVVLATSPATLLDRWPAPIVGILAFIFSEATFFGCLILAWIEYRYRSPSGPGPWDLDIPRTAIFSVCLFASSGTIYLAERQLHRGNERGFRWWWLATIVLGATFLIGQITEYIAQYREGITIDQNLFTSAFYTLTGFHGLHVIVGLIMLVTLLCLAFAGDFRHGRRRTLLNVVSIYWHFVDAVWVVVFSLVYLWTLAG
jgi:cytochrome c oxidase subunit I